MHTPLHAHISPSQSSSTLNSKSTYLDLASVKCYVWDSTKVDDEEDQLRIGHVGKVEVEDAAKKTNLSQLPWGLRFFE